MRPNHYIGSQESHDELTDRVEGLLQKKGYTTFRNVEYRARHSGEIDVYALKDGYILAFEMKSGHGKKCDMHAREQLDRMERYYFSRYNYDKLFRFIVHWDGNDPTYSWYKHQKGKS